MKHFSFSLVLFLSVSLFGCAPRDNRPADIPPLFPTVITIIQDGVPLQGASVVLIPDDGNRDWYVSGTTNTDGITEMMASSRWAGAPKGRYKVIVRKFESDPSRLPSLPEDADHAAREAHELAVSNERLNSYFVLEPVFADPVSTPLTLTVDGQTNETFDVGKAVRIIVR
jgi:hypothetical protein